MSMDQAVGPNAAVRPRPRTRDIVTVGTLLGATLFLVLPLGLVWATIVWLAGAWLLWSSPTWSNRDKSIGTLVWPGGLIGPALALTSVGQVCTQVVQSDSGAAGQIAGEPVCTGVALSPWVGLPLAVIVIAAPFAVAVFLLNRSNST